METFKLNFHSVVDVITNSSTVIYTYQDGCEKPAKELINEMLKLSGESEKKADDIFYFGVFCDENRYMDFINEEYDYDDGSETDELSNIPALEGEWGSNEYKKSESARQLWFENLQLSIAKGEVEQPDWMNRAEEGRDYGWKPSTYLVLYPKEEKYIEFGRKIAKLLDGVDADGGRDG